MAPAGQGQAWSDVLCCVDCSRIFGRNHLPINLLCGHVLCSKCAQSVTVNRCPVDEAEGELVVKDYPVNVALLSVAIGDEEITRSLPSLVNLKNKQNAPNAVMLKLERSLAKLASHLKKVNSERGGTVFSEILSRTVQRKLVTLICYQLVEEEGRSRALKTCRALADRIMTEVLLSQQAPSSLSTSLWTAVRARGCQFLGPAMQEDVLKLILLALGQGAPIARKTLVMYVVRMLTEEYPQVSKTCVGHVVQLLYRASCFHVLKRDGESSLMQLKEEFRNYEALRKEHDSQIVQMAMEANLRISPDQWSALLYGDQQHRSHMQSIIDKLQSPQAYQQSLDELIAVYNKGDTLVGEMIPFLEVFAEVHPTHHEKVSWARFGQFVFTLSQLLDLHVAYVQRRKEQRVRDYNFKTTPQRYVVVNEQANSQHRYKTKMCRDVANGQACPRGQHCTWAHSNNEMRETNGRGKNLNGSQFPSMPPVMQNPGNGGPVMVNQMTHMQQQMGTMMPPMNPPPAFQQQVIHGSGMGHSDVMPFMPVVMQSPTHLPPQMLFVQQQSATGMMIPSSPPSAAPPGIWQTSPSMMMPLPHQSPPHIPQTFWIQPPTAVYSFDSRNDPFDDKNRNDDQDADQLQLKRKEILSRLAPYLDDEEMEDVGSGHVSYRVASSVLEDRFDLYSHTHPIYPIGPAPPLDLPTVAGNFTTVISPTGNEDNRIVMGEHPGMTPGRARAGSLTRNQLVNGDLATPSTVQQECGDMQVVDTMSQPLSTPAIQRTHVVSIVPAGLDSQIVTPILHPIATVIYPQDVISNTLDRIVDVKERLNEAEGAPMSSAVSEQLRVELQIAERDMYLLDPRTQASCLLKELEHVDRAIERIEANRPIENSC